jgi:hypothetical protein
MDTEITQVLDAIPELGFVKVTTKEVFYTPPQCNLLEWRSLPVLGYLKRYAQIRDFEGEFFLCLYDGWREYSKPFENPVFVPWKDVDPTRFTGLGSEGEPRFMHRVSDGIFPTMPLPVLTFCRHKGDKNALLIPDAQYLPCQFSDLVEQVKRHDLDWSDKKGDVLYWRGSPTVSSYPQQVDPHPREFITSSKSSFVDASYSTDTPIADQLGHKYLIDADGMVNAWSGLFWKLSSNSVPVKISSHWEQWYYGFLRDGENIIMSDLDLGRTFRRLTENDAIVREVAQAGKKLASRLTYEYACRDYVIS